ncbi:MAG: hypothetical protein QOE70_2942 [Chthoniobacter sp.]|nr:hypothetical protein [Chthoniobacter sp.]
MTERWIVNASPLILLGKSGQLDWLSRMGEIIIPSAVADEVAAGATEDPARQWIASQVGKALIREGGMASEELLAWDLGRGETAVIAWARENPEHEAVLDDAAARRCAGVYGLRFRGTLSFVALAKKRGLVAECRPIFARLQAAGLFVTPALVEQVARTVGE